MYLKHDFNVVVHLAAQAGFRYSLINPESYINSNLVGIGNVLEMCRDKISRILFLLQVVVFMEMIKDFYLMRILV